MIGYPGSIRRNINLIVEKSKKMPYGWNNSCGIFVNNIEGYLCISSIVV